MDLRQRLEAAGIDLSEWGKGEAKTLAHLQKEVDDGETEIITIDGGELLRKVTVCDAFVYAVSPEGKKLRLREDRQVFKDGRERRRKLEPSIFEKMKVDEDPRLAMIRGVKEELGLEGDIDIAPLRTEEETVMSPSFPGLSSCYVVHFFEVMLHGDQFRPEGYMEEQADKSTYFVWEEIM